ncbi:MAG: response regulator transcription factor [Dehalococcoidia bacterium]|nr:response regulator transcription factor [Dehalococcoidia bacterium]MDD5494120.1 response regulator transcription factor [Dehalococcoidia bacterium]
MDRIRILLAEDHKVVREGTRRLLESQDDFDVVGEASDGVEAVELTKKLKPEIIIMDVSMPRLNGIEATKQIKALYSNIAVLVLTGYDDDEYVFALLEAGAAGYLLKESSGEELIEAIRQVMTGEPVLHPKIMKKVLNRLRSPVEEQSVQAAGEVLSDREMEVLRLAAKGGSNMEIAESLTLSVRTVQTHLRSIFNKLGVGSRSEAIVFGLKKGWLTLEELP